jgi:hypothetical protein
LGYFDRTQTQEVFSSIASHLREKETSDTIYQGRKEKYLPVNAEDVDAIDAGI